MLTLGSLKLYLGEKAFRCATGEIRIPVPSPHQRSWDTIAQIANLHLAGIDGMSLSTGPSTSDAFYSWWRPLTVGPQTRATHFIGDIVPSSVIMTDWMSCVREPVIYSSSIPSLGRSTSYLISFVGWVEILRRHTLMAAGSQVLIRELVVVMRLIPLHHYMPYIDFGAGGLSFSDIRGPNHLLILRISLIRLTLFRPVLPVI